MKVIVGNKELSVTPSKAIGKGGEADVYKVGAGEVVKIFKSSKHPDISGMPREQQAAEERLQEHQSKLSRFPSGLPSRVIVPSSLAHNSRGKVVGYTMPLVSGAEVLLRYGQRSFREGRVDEDEVLRVFRDIYATVSGLHHKEVVIGDFNDLNILVKGADAYFIDADSYQFENFFTRVFTKNFIDPLIASQIGGALQMAKPHTQMTDWYAYAIMLMQSLLYVGPYGGVYKPKDKQKRISRDERLFKRVTVFDSEVIYPKPARPIDSLPLDLAHYFHEVFTKDVREMFPERLISNIEWKECPSCGLRHARVACPECIGGQSTRVKEVHTGKISAVKVFDTSGIILHASAERKKLRWLYHVDEMYKREDDSVVVRAPLDPHVRYRIRGKETILAKGSSGQVFVDSECALSISIDAYGMLPLFDTNSRALVYAENGTLKRVKNSRYDYPERIGNVLANQTLFWTGDDFGFGFYRAGNLSQFFVFDVDGTSINDSVYIPPLRGQLVDSTAVFGKDRVWFFVATRELGVTVNRIYIVHRYGEVIAEKVSDDESGIDVFRGTAAIGDVLFAPTDAGIVRLEIDQGNIVIGKEFPDTARFVNSSNHLFIGDDGIFVVRDRDIWKLTV